MQDKKINVIHVIWSGTFGGIEKLTYDLCSAQQQSNHIHSELLICKNEKNYFEKFINSSFKIHLARLNNGFDISPSKLYRTFRLFKKSDIIHFHSFNPFVFFLGIISEKKIIYTEHGTFGKGRTLSFTARCGQYFKKLFLNRSVDFISFNSASTKTEAERMYGLQNVNRKIIYNGIDLVARQINQLLLFEIKNRFQNKFIVGTTSRFVEFKRIEKLIEAFAELSKGKETLLLLVGEGPLKEKYKKQVDAAGISDKVIFAGYQKEIATWQMAMDVCVFPSEKEPFGLAAIETLSLGKPVIVFNDAGGLIEIINETEPENIVSNSQQLSQRLNYYYINRQAISDSEVKRKARASEFDINKMSVQFNEAYDSVLKARH